jgi:CheY-like chemotaxis protein
MDGDLAPLVLVADNDIGVNHVLREVLRRQGVRAEAVADGTQALARLRLGGVALLVCDLDMPTMSGEELLAETATWVEPPPTVVISGYLDADSAERLRRHPHVRQALRKPFDVLAFGRLVANLARRSSRSAGRGDGHGGGNDE